jgi:hypothetical protein
MTTLATNPEQPAVSPQRQAQINGIRSTVLDGLKRLLHSREWHPFAALASSIDADTAATFLKLTQPDTYSRLRFGERAKQGRQVLLEELFGPLKDGGFEARDGPFGLEVRLVTRNKTHEINIPLQAADAEEVRRLLQATEPQATRPGEPPCRMLYLFTSKMAGDTGLTEARIALLNSADGPVLQGLLLKGSRCVAWPPPTRSLDSALPAFYGGVHYQLRLQPE